MPFGALYERALGILYHLQRMGARRGDIVTMVLRRGALLAAALSAEYGEPP